MVPGLGSVRLVQQYRERGHSLLTDGPDPPFLEKWQSLKESDRFVNQVNDFLVCLKQHEIGVIPIVSDQYPNWLADTPQPPWLLYTKGNQELLKQPAVAMVGGRAATAVGLRMAKLFADTVSKNGCAVISGLAKGIDTAVHQGAISKTISVFAGGLDDVYPNCNKALANNILKHDGLWISEHPPATKLNRGLFTRRNRIVVGLSRAVVVIEAAAKSGSLVSAQYAIDYGRELFAVPGNPEQAINRGCHQLIRQGAQLIDSVPQLVADLNLIGDTLVLESPKQDPLTQTLYQLLGQPCSVAQVAMALNVDLIVASELILQLVSKNIVKQTVAGYQLVSD